MAESKNLRPTGGDWLMLSYGKRIKQFEAIVQQLEEHLNTRSRELEAHSEARTRELEKQFEIRTQATQKTIGEYLESQTVTRMPHTWSRMY